MGADDLRSPVLAGGWQFHHVNLTIGIPELSPSPTRPPNFSRLALTASSSLFRSRTATPVVPGWTSEHILENDTGQVKLRESANHLEVKSETSHTGLYLEKSSRTSGMRSDVMLIDG